MITNANAPQQGGFRPLLGLGIYGKKCKYSAGVQMCFFAGTWLTERIGRVQLGLKRGQLEGLPRHVENCTKKYSPIASALAPCLCTNLERHLLDLTLDQI